MKIIIFTLILLFISSCMLSPSRLAGDYEFNPEKQKLLMGNAEKELIDKAFSGVDFARVRDTHVHLIGVGHNDSGIELRPGYESIFNLKSYLRYNLFLKASGLSDSPHLDQDYIDRLVKLIRDGGLKYKHHILAFDRHYNENGKVVESHTEMYIPNEYSYKMAQKYPDIFEPVISVHPYRKDAVKEINRWGEKGVKYIKWLPNAMGINPSHDLTTNFYKAVKRWDMTILSHVGIEKSVESGEVYQSYGNPLLLKKPLDMGVKIIAAHCASKGEFKDLENNGELQPGHKLLFRLLNRDKYDNVLRVDMSATVTGDRLDGAILDMLAAPLEIQKRFVYGSDYPVPGVNIFIPLKKVYRAGLINKSDIVPLRNIYRVNPMLFNFVLFRTVKDPKTGRPFDLEALYL